MIAGTITNNWVFDQKEPKDVTNKALKKAKEVEKSKLKKGWRWKRVHSSLSMLVPCDKKGNPTKEGADMIAKYKEMLRLP